MPLSDNQFARPVELTAKELKIRKKLLKRFENDILSFNSLTAILDERLSWADHVKKNKSVNERFAALFIAQNHSVLNNALDLITLGYELESLILIRPAAERIVLTIYFCEFPDDLNIYRKKLGYRKFYAHLKRLGYANYLEGALNRIEKEGVLWRNSQTAGWAHELHTSLIDEPSRLLHVDEAYGLTASVRGAKIIRGPHARIGSSKVVISKIRQATLWSIIALLIAHDMPLRYWEEVVIRRTLDELYGTKSMKDLESFWSTEFSQ